MIGAGAIIVGAFLIALYRRTKRKTIEKYKMVLLSMYMYERRTIFPIICVPLPQSNCFRYQRN